jgi:hypothetical protein
MIDFLRGHVPAVTWLTALPLVAVNSMPSVAGRLDRVSPPATCFEKLPGILKIPENWRS